MKFLEEIAHGLLHEHGTDFSNVTVVLPANRAKLFLKQHLHKAANGPMLLPRMLVMPELVQWLSGSQPAGELSLFLALYKSYTASCPAADHFVDYCKWAHIMLKDFNDVDQHLVPAEILFANLREVDYVQQWSFGNNELTGTQLNFESFWNDMACTYAHRQTEVNAPRSYAQLLKQLAIADDAGWQEKLNNQHMWFVGIASFTPAEATLLKKIDEACTTRTVWDADAYYVRDEQNHAGDFLRKQLTAEQKSSLPENFSTSSKSIGIYQSITSVGEVMVLASHLALLNEQQLNDTAIVLADLSLAEPLMQLFPSQPVPVNMALGLPLAGTPPGQWVKLLFAVNEEAQSGYVRHQLLREWLGLAACMGADQEAMHQITQAMDANKHLRVSVDTMKQLMQHNALHGWFELLTTSGSEAFFSRLISAFVNALNFMTDEYYSAALTSLHRAASEMLMALPQHPFVQSMGEAAMVWQHAASKELISFAGEPLHGIQVLSLAETRALDFSHVFILGANEETLPGNAQQVTYIPWDIRHHYGMPLPDDREAMVSYGIYRLLQRATDIGFYSCSITSDFRGSEPSRYIQQLRHELPIANESALFHEKKYQLQDDEHPGEKDKMPNDAFAHARLTALFENGISPSAIGKFIRCPLDFYYRYIIGLGESDEIEEQLSSATFGSIVHMVLEHFYKQYFGSCPEPNDFEVAIPLCEENVRKAFNKLIPGADADEGFNALALTVAQEMLRKYFTSEKNELQQAGDVDREILDVECDLARTVNNEKYDWPHTVRIKGKADRIEQRAGQVQIIDYKTGKVADEDFVLKKDWSSIFSNEKGHKLIQLFSYIYMYCANGRSAENVTAAFYSFRNYKSGYTFVDTQGTSMDAVLQEFEQALMQWVKDVYALESFEHNENAKHCIYCSEVKQTN
ncbi:MAG: PD-(D/E)XK nuclease family protein [Flavobacteriales bacterium]